MWLDWLRKRWRDDVDELPAVDGESAMGSRAQASPPGSLRHRFAFDLLTAWPPGDARAMSPHNLALALAILAHSAAGETAEELRAALGVEPGPESLDRLLVDLVSARPEGRYERLQSAAALWPDLHASLADEFLDELQSRFGVGITRLDLSEKPAAAGRVNDWARASTRGRIGQIADPQMVPEPPGVLLSTAFYYDGRWEHPFDADDTVAAPFHAPRETLRVPMMRQTLDARYGATRRFEIVQLPYRGACHMTVVLPAKDTSLDAVVDGFRDSSSFARAIAGARRRKVELSLPKVSLDTGPISVREVLQVLGIHRLFGRDTADLKRLAPSGPCWVDEVVHRATLDVDEEGTVAAAATVLGMPLAALDPPRPIRMCVDRPYLMLLQHRDHTVLFAAAVTKPPMQRSAES